jgi:hypothetical protein
MLSRRSYVPSKLLIRKINKRHLIPASAGMTRKWDSSGSNPNNPCNVHFWPQAAC